MKETVPLKVVYRKTGDLIPYVNNARTHSEQQITQIASSIKEFGFNNPILTDGDNGVVAGHGRLLAAQKLGLQEVPTIELSHLSEAQKKAYIIADNKIALNSGWDGDLLKLELNELELNGISADLVGFTDEELEALLAGNEGDTLGEDGADDITPEKPEHPKTQRGDVWTLGRHRLMCGSSSAADDVKTLLNGASPEILLTDPPYCSGGFQEAGRRSGSIGSPRRSGEERPTILNDKLSTRGYMSLIGSVLTLSSCQYAYIFTDWRMWCYLYDTSEAAGFSVRSMLVWDKQSPGVGYGWRAQHEIIMFVCKQTAHFDNTKSHGNVIQCKRSLNPLHPTQKPIELINTLLEVRLKASGVYDAFAGSGTTLIACEKAGEPCWCMELSPNFCDVIIKRWQDYTGQKAVRQDGIEWDAL